MMIFISIGHYTGSPGACYNSFCEFDEAARWAEIIYEMLGPGEAMLVPVGMLKEKVRFINVRNPTLAIEMHFNSAVTMRDGKSVHVGNGAVTLHYPGSSRGKLLATHVQEGLEQIFTRHQDGVMPGYYRMDKRYGPDFFLAQTSCPSIIVEPEFIHNQDLIVSNRETGCAAIASGLITAKRSLVDVIRK